MTFRLTMYPALDGDCLVLTWGKTSKHHHMIVDLGRADTYNGAREELASLDNVALFVMTHVDADHIAGAIPMIRETAAPFKPKRVWYNARPQLVAAKERQPITEPFGARQGEKLARGIVNFDWPWNREFESEVVSTGSPEAAVPIDLEDGLTVRLLSPTDTALAALLPEWDKELKKAKIRTFDPDEEDNPLGPRFEPFGLPNVTKLANEPYEPDHAEANGSSIALLAEFEGKRVLLGGDAFSELLDAALTPLAAAEGGRYRVDLFKLGHHGSKANTSKKLPALVDCTRFAISTNGTRHNHPDPPTIARLLTNDVGVDKTLYFNYRQPQTELWESGNVQKKFTYKCVFPVEAAEDSANGRLTIDV